MFKMPIVWNLYGYWRIMQDFKNILFQGLRKNECVHKHNIKYFILRLNSVVSYLQFIIVQMVIVYCCSCSVFQRFTMAISQINITFLNYPETYILYTLSIEMILAKCSDLVVNYFIRKEWISRIILIYKIINTF